MYSMIRKILKSLKRMERGTAIIILIEIAVLVFFLISHLYLGIHRYFDVDEFAHLHWAFDAYSGLKPYTQFLYFFPPFFLYLLSVVFLFTGKSAAAFIAGRLVSFGFFALLVTVLFFLVKKMRDTQTALFAAIVLSFLPLPFDKFLEIRPDLPAVVLAMAGMYMLIEALEITPPRGSTSTHPAGRVLRLFLSGFFYGLSVAMLPKVVFFLPPVVLVLILYCFTHPAGRVFGQRLIQVLKSFGIGFGIPAVFTLVLFFLSGNVSRAVYLTVTFANESAKLLGYKFPMHGSLFFYPNDTYYAASGVSLPLLVNLAIYIVATVWGVIRCVSFLDQKTRGGAYAQLLVAGTFLLNFMAYMKFFPLKHAQYLIPIAPFIAFYFADAVMEVAGKLKSSGGRIRLIVSRVSLLSILGVMIVVGWRMNMVKKNWTNETMFSELQRVYRVIPKDAYVLDLFGETLIYKDPYYICCIPYGQYAEAFAFRLPSLAEALKRTQTKYIFLHSEDRLKILPALDEKFVREHYAIAYTEPMILLPGTLFPIDSFQAKSFDLIASGNYAVSVNNREILPIEFGKVKIDGKAITQNPVYMTNGDHTIEVGEKGLVKLQFQREERVRP